MDRGDFLNRVQPERLAGPAQQEMARFKDRENSQAMLCSVTLYLSRYGQYLPAKIQDEGYILQALQAGFTVIAKGCFNLESPPNRPFASRVLPEVEIG